MLVTLFFFLPLGRFNLVYVQYCVTIPPAVRPTLLRQMDMGSLTCAHIWVRAVQHTTQRIIRDGRSFAKCRVRFFLGSFKLGRVGRMVIRHWPPDLEVAGSNPGSDRNLPALPPSSLSLI